MRALQIAQDIDLDGPGTATGSAIDLLAENFPFQPGNTVVCAGAVDPFGQDAEGQIALQGRETTSDSWEDLAVFVTGPVRFVEVVLTRYVRYAVQSVTAGDGRGSLTLLGN